MPEADPPALGLEVQFKFAAMRAEVRGERNPELLRAKALKLVELMETQQRVMLNMARGNVSKACPMLPAPQPPQPPLTLALEPREIFDEAVIGWGQRPGDPTMILVYDYDACIRALMDHKGWDAPRAAAFVSSTTAGTWMGPGTPLIISREGKGH